MYPITPKFTASPPCPGREPSYSICLLTCHPSTLTPSIVAALVAELFGTGVAGNPTPQSPWADCGIINGVGQAPLIPPMEARPPAPGQDQDREGGREAPMKYQK